MSNTTNAIHENEKNEVEDGIHKQNQTQDQFFDNIYMFLNGDM